MFLSTFRAADDRSPFGNFWFAPVTSNRGLSRVTSDSAMQLTAVYACVRNLSEDFAKLPFRLYRPKAGGGKENVTDHWLYHLFARKPNRFQTPFEFREMLTGHLELRGNAFCDISANSAGEITELTPIHPDKVRVEMLANGSYRYRVKQPDGVDVIYRRDQLWHLRGLSSDGIVGINPIEAQAAALGVGISAQDYAARYFANDAKPSGGWIEFPGKFADKTAKQIFKDGWQEQQGGGNRGKTAVLEMGMKYHEIGINNRDSQFLESRQASRSEIASIFRMPPHKIGDLTRATFSNIEQQSIEYGTDTLSPRCERWEASIELNLLGADTDLQVEFDLRSLMRGDAASRSAYFNGGINGGWLTRNEVRAEEGYNPLDGLDEPLQPLNMVGAGEVPAEAPAAAPAAPEPDARLVTLLTGNAGRIARRVASGKPTGADVVADAMAVSIEAAATWLQATEGNTDETKIIASLLTLAGL